MQMTDVLKDWKCPAEPKFTVVPDEIKDGLDFAANTFEGLLKLNDALHSAGHGQLSFVRKFKATLADASAEASRTHLQQILFNLDVIHSHFSQLQDATTPFPDSVGVAEHACKQALIRLQEELAKLPIKVAVTFAPAHGIIVGDMGGACLRSEARLVLAEIERITASKLAPLTPEALVYRASRDGASNGTFHSKCDGKARLLSIIHAKTATGPLCVFGGFTSVGFSNNGTSRYIRDPQAFIFTLRNPHTFGPTIYQCTGLDNAIHYNSGYGPVFGGGYDIKVDIQAADKVTSSYCSLGSAYKDTTGKGRETMTGAYDGWYIIDVFCFKL